MSDDPSKKPEYSTMYVELDCLLDTRMALLFSMNEIYAKNALEAGWYDRITDVVPGVDYDEFLKAYSNRKKDILQHAVMTPIKNMVQEFVLRTAENSVNSPFLYVPKIVINVFPYDMSSEEMHVFGDTFAEITKYHADVEVINRDPKLISPLQAKLGYAVMVMYRYDQWIEHQASIGMFKKYSMPEVTLIGPRIIFKKMTRSLKEGEKPFDDIEEEIGPLVGIQLINAENFSMAVKLTK